MRPCSAAIGCGAARAQPLLYAQRLPEGTVYVRLASALPLAASVATEFAGTVELGADGAGRISPYFVAGDAGGKTVAHAGEPGRQRSEAAFQPKSGAFITVVLHAEGAGVTASVVVDKPEYNQTQGAAELLQRHQTTARAPSLSQRPARRCSARSRRTPARRGPSTRSPPP